MRSTNEERHAEYVERAIFEYYYRKYYKYIRSYCSFRYGLTQSDEDVIQEVFLNFWAKGVKQINLILSPESYLKAIARNVLYRVWEKNRKHIYFGEIPKSYIGRDPYETQRNFYELIAPLSSEERLVLELCYLQGCDSIEAARRIHISRRTCFRRLKVARQKLSRLYAADKRSPAKSGIRRQSSA